MSYVVIIGFYVAIIENVIITSLLSCVSYIKSVMTWHANNMKGALIPSSLT